MSADPSWMEAEVFDFVEEDRNGEVITFYSFKGGVGRTMALANAAFLAACNGKKVLVIDWDLEAPGLAYYFRGLHDPSVIRGLKQSEGVLNFLWDWVNRVTGDTKEAIEGAAELFSSGTPFETCTRELVDPEFFESSTGGIDYIGAGSAKILAPGLTDYEEALARFPWHDFFTKMAGGFVPHALRTWAKKNYDFILVDSRTGLAESAGLCTMQLPDSVALCFVLNRQNIEGISRISGAIRLNRPDVRLYAAPMRVAREGTSEESDARAKAITDLTRIGGFTVDAAQQQLQSLGIKHADNVPFYEALAPIVAEDPEVDQLSLNYVRFCREVLRLPQIALIPLESRLVDRARARLQPQFATSEHVEKLLGSEPLRAITELRSLISSAEELVANGERGALSDEYLRLLTAAAFAPRPIQFADQVYELQRQALNILRMLRETSSDWAPAFIEALEAHLLSNLVALDDESEVSVREELDAQLALLPGSTQAIRRLANRRRIAWLHFRTDDDISSITATEIISRLKGLREEGDLSQDGSAELQFIEADTLHLKGRIEVERGHHEDAVRCWRSAIETCAQVDWDQARSDLRKTITDVHALIALVSNNIVSLDERKNHALMAARINGAGLSTSPPFIQVLSMLADGDSPEILLRFLQLTVGAVSAQTRGAPMAVVWSRSVLSAARLLQVFRDAASALRPIRHQDVVPVLQRMAAVADSLITQVARRRVINGSRKVADIPRYYDELLDAINNAGFRADPGQETIEALSALRQESPRDRMNRQ